MIDDDAMRCAHLFAEQHGQRFVYVHCTPKWRSWELSNHELGRPGPRSGWHAWDGRRWRPDAEPAVWRAVYDVLAADGRVDFGYGRADETIRDLLRFASTLKAFTAAPADLRTTDDRSPTA